MINKEIYAEATKIVDEKRKKAEKIANNQHRTLYLHDKKRKLSPDFVKQLIGDGTLVWI
jgi:hypothetical protein